MAIFTVGNILSALAPGLAERQSRLARIVRRHRRAGNAIGAAAGAVVLNANLGYAAVMYVGAVLTLLALALVAWSAVTQRRPAVVMPLH